jgi:hypothetical protein
MELELPISLENGVKIVSQSEEGFFLISYPDAEGKDALVYWPDRFKRFKAGNPQEGQAIRIVQAFIIDRLCNAQDSSSS